MPTNGPFLRRMCHLLLVCVSFLTEVYKSEDLIYAELKTANF